MKTILATTLSLFIFCISSAQNQCDNHCRADAGSDKSSCCGGLTIGGTTCQDNAPDPVCPGNHVTFSWSPSTGLSCTTCCNPTANPSVTTTYTLSVTFTCGVGAGSAGCCCDGCSGNTCADVGSPNECNGSVVRPDQMTFIRTTPNCCRIINPDLLPEMDNDGVRVYPIPSDGIFSVELTSDRENLTVNVFDALGKLVFNQDKFSDKVISIDISDSPKGVYYVQVKSGEEVISFKKTLFQ